MWEGQDMGEGRGAGLAGAGCSEERTGQDRPYVVCVTSVERWVLCFQQHHHNRLTVVYIQADGNLSVSRCLLEWKYDGRARG